MLAVLGSVPSVVQIGGQHHGHLDPGALKGFFYFFDGIVVSGDGKVSAGLQFMDQFGAQRTAGPVPDADTGPLELVGHGVTKQDDLHHRHAEQDQQGAPVAQDMVELFSYEGKK